MVDFSDIFFNPLAAFFVGLSAALAANGKHRISAVKIIRKLLFAIFALIVTRPIVDKTEFVKHYEFVVYALCGAFGNVEFMDIAKRAVMNFLKGGQNDRTKSDKRETDN